MKATFLRLSPVSFSVVSNTFAQIVGKAATAGTTFFITLFIARAFGAQGYGDFTKITTYVALFFLFADFGMNATYLQKSAISHQPSAISKTEDIWWNALLGIRLVGSVFLLFLAIAVLSFLPQSATDGFTGLVRLGIILYSPAIVFLALLTTANAYFQKHLRYGFSALAVSVGSMTALVLVWIAAGIFTKDAGTLGSVIALAIGSLVTAGVAFFFVRRIKQSLSPSFNRSMALTLLKASIPLGATLIFNVVYFRIDSLIMTLTRTTAEVGIYGLAYKVFEFPIAIPTFIMNSVYPLFLATRSHELGIRNYELRKKFRTMFLFMILTSCFMILVLWFAAPLLTRIRPEFGASVAALRVLSLSLPFFFLTSLTMWTIIALKKQTALLFIYGCSMVVTILADLVFIPTHGVMAAAWITVGSEAMVLAVSAFVLLRWLRDDTNVVKFEALNPKS